MTWKVTIPAKRLIQGLNGWSWFHPPVVVEWTGDGEPRVRPPDEVRLTLPQNFK